MKDRLQLRHSLAVAPEGMVYERPTALKRPTKRSATDASQGNYMRRTKKISFFLLCVVLAGSAGATNVPVVAISASGDDGNVARNVIDGNPSTRWSCPIPPGASCWIQADLGTVRDLATIGIGWYQGNMRSNTFGIRTSDDGQVFSTVWAGTNKYGLDHCAGDLWHCPSARTVRTDLCNRQFAPQRVGKYHRVGNRRADVGCPAYQQHHRLR